MLGIHRLTSAGADYYLSDLDRELPVPVGWGDGRSEWVGRAAEGLGLRGDIDPAQLRAVLGGRLPATGQRIRSERATVLAFDMTFSAPKSVSVLFALGGEDVARHVLAAHREGVHGALTYVEKHGLTAQRGSGERREVVPTTGLVAGSFTHGVNRNLDPHLHTHVVVANMVHGLDGRWSACDHRGLSAHRSASSAVYDAHVRAELSARMSVRWTAEPGWRAEIDGVSPLLRGEFSSRAADIRRHISAWGSHSARGAHVAWAATRPEKQTGLRFDELSEQWERRAQALGDGRAEIAALLGRQAKVPDREVINEHRFGGVLSLVPAGAARRRDVAAAFGISAVGGARASALEHLTDLWAPGSTSRSAVGVAEGMQPLRSVVPGGHLLRTLGPRPVDHVEHEVWRDAATSIENYRRRWNVTKSADALGVDALHGGLSSLPANRLVDHLRTARHVEVARQRLGWRAPRTLELDRGR